MLGQQGGGGVVARAKVRTVKVKPLLPFNYNSFQGVEVNLLSIFNRFQSFSVQFCSSLCVASIFTKIGTTERRLAWPLCKEDMQNREEFHIFKNTFS